MYNGCGVGVECLLEGVGESPREAIFALSTVAIGYVGGDLDAFVLFLSIMYQKISTIFLSASIICCCFCYIHRWSFLVLEVLLEPPAG